MNQAPAMSVLVATNHLRGWSGSEILTLTLIRGLLQRDLRVALYARHLDYEWVKGKIGSNVQFTDDIDSLRSTRFDLSHVQHSPTAVDVRLAFPSLPILFSSLGVLPFLEQPLPFEIGISHYLAVSEEVRDNLVVRGIATDSIDIVGNIVDESLFRPLRPVRPKVGRILVLSYKLGDQQADFLCSAAAQLGASVRFIGRGNRVVPNETLCSEINDADIVVSLGRGVIETMLCGRVPLVFDKDGGDGLVTPDNFDDLGKCNFSGRWLRRQFSADELVVQLRKYQPEFGEQLRKMAMDRYSLAASMERVVTIYQKVASTPVSFEPPMSTRRILEYFGDVTHEDRRFTAALFRLQNEIDRIKATASWRLTGPLRMMRNLWKLFVQRLSSASTK